MSTETKGRNEWVSTSLEFSDYQEAPVRRPDVGPKMLHV